MTSNTHHRDAHIVPFGDDQCGIFLRASGPIELIRIAGKFVLRTSANLPIVWHRSREVARLAATQSPLVGWRKVQVEA